MDKYLNGMGNNVLNDGYYTTIKQLKRGDFFKLSDKPNAIIYVRGEYDKSLKKYECYKFYDCNDFTFKNGNKTVITGFTF